ncbi:IS1380 family transposase [Dactylosporangium sp. NBC_01737]|uniref:IS1380 family transposase n=1 Tax=Dactylosporangium sp. NBC_01737 TaxID=2975959 RepID=UPI002E12766C|nr:IS1380 family transposase [Dactylosporangium sp. NBC_01737]WSG46205.1 IS1380 family transposase [Dactylosporangium sp. NBC_01737]
MVKRTGARPKIVVSGDGRGVVSHAGARLLADVAAVTGLTAACSDALAGVRQRRGGHDPGRVAVDLAVMLADGGEAIADLAVLRDQAQLFGPVASDPTAWRLLSMMDSDMLRRLATARAQARETAWAQRIDVRSGLPETTAAGLPVPGLVLDLDASIVICHSEKEAATPTWKRSFGYHPLFCFLDNTREALSGMLREGRAGSNTTADHITVLDDALTQIPDQFRHGTPILIRADSAGCTQGLLAHIRGLRGDGVDARFSVGVAITEPIRQAILTAKTYSRWVPALDSDGEPRDGADVCELTGLVPDDGFPPGTRFIARREVPHPGAQLSLFDTVEGLRHQVMATDTPAGGGSVQFLEARHRGHARVEDRIRTGKDTGFGRFPSRVFAINAAWLQLALTGIDLLSWTQMLLLHGDLAVAEPKKLRYRLLHIAARLTTSARRIRLRIAEHWPWATDLVAAYSRLAALPRPVG